MNIAIIGAGNVGKTLGPALRAKGHTVSYGTRDPAKAEQLNAIQLALNKHGRDFAFVMARRDAANRNADPRVRMVQPHPQEAE
ncbi:MAG: 2-dehydropantoate 2-reductase N-terminal domain-containing protein [Methyloceanibacter sp.]|jgi:predicted dinucleotide-binding enzyme